MIEELHLNLEMRASRHVALYNPIVTTVVVIQRAESWELKSIETLIKVVLKHTELA